MRLLDEAANSAETYLLTKESETIRNRNLFKMSLMAYAFTFSANPNRAKKLLAEMKVLGKLDDDRNWMHWPRSPYKIETAAYMLMASLKSGTLTDVQAIANYLNGQRSYTGTFDSTQDTIVALEALSRLAEVQVSSLRGEMKLAINITADANRMTRSIQFDKANAQVMQRFKWKPLTDQLDFTTIGNGMVSAMCVITF